MVKDLTCVQQGRGFKSFQVIMWVSWSFRCMMWVLSWQRWVMSWRRRGHKKKSFTCSGMVGSARIRSWLRRTRNWPMDSCAFCCNVSICCNVVWAEFWWTKFFHPILGHIAWLLYVPCGGDIFEKGTNFQSFVLVGLSMVTRDHLKVIQVHLQARSGVDVV